MRLPNDDRGNTPSWPTPANCGSKDPPGASKRHYVCPALREPRPWWPTPIFHTDRELNRAGLTTLRFNFRGVGDSEGTHDDGRGETDDLAHASAWLQALMPEAPHLLVGYSFGAICSVRHAARSQNVRAVIAIGLPVRLYPLEEIDQLPCPLAIVQGTDDEFGTPEEIRARTPGSPIQTIDKATHLFPGTAAAAATAVVRLTQSFL